MRGTCDRCGRHHRQLQYIEDPNTYESAYVCRDPAECTAPPEPYDEAEDLFRLDCADSEAGRMPIFGDVGGGD